MSFGLGILEGLQVHRGDLKSVNGGTRGGVLRYFLKSISRLEKRMEVGILGDISFGQIQLYPLPRTLIFLEKDVAGVEAMASL